MHCRHSIRIKGYDYTSPGAYFITIVTYRREGLFGEISNGKMELNGMGKIVERVWHDLVNHYSNIELGSFVVMPNHVHGIIVIKEVGAGLRPVPTQSIKRHGLPEIVRAFKSFSARRVNEHLNSRGIHLWQRNYYEHIIRNEHEWNNIRLYIEANPANWIDDKENPSNTIIEDSIAKIK